MGHGYSSHRICPKILTWVPDVCPLTNTETIDSSPSRLESQTSVRRPTLKLFGLSHSRLKYEMFFCQPTRNLFGSSPSRLSFDQRRNCWVTYPPSFLQPSQTLLNHVLGVCPPTATETKMSPFVSTTEDYNSNYILIKLITLYFITQWRPAFLIVLSVVSTNLSSPCQPPSTRSWMAFHSQRSLPSLGIQHITPSPMSIWN